MLHRLHTICSWWC